MVLMMDKNLDKYDLQYDIFKILKKTHLYINNTYIYSDNSNKDYRL